MWIRRASMFIESHSFRWRRPWAYNVACKTHTDIRARTVVVLCVESCILISIVHNCTTWHHQQQQLCVCVRLSKLSEKHSKRCLIYAYTLCTHVEETYAAGFLITSIMYVCVCICWLKDYISINSLLSLCVTKINHGNWIKTVQYFFYFVF